jgi:prepilin-type processing-associated H-X9-DG protein
LEKGINAMRDNPYESPESEDKTATPETDGARWGVRLIEMLAVVGVICVLVALLLPATRGSGEAARRIHCSNNLKQIALALRLYADEFGALPPAATVDANGNPLHSWRTLILPYLEQKRLYEKIDLAKPWDDPANAAAFESAVPFYCCLSADAPPTHTTYLAVAALGGCFRPNEPRTLSEITDGHGQVLMVIESPADDHVHWMSPTDASEEALLKFATATNLSHRNGFNAVFVDGSTRFLNAELSATRLRALISIAGNDDEAAQRSD